MNKELTQSKSTLSSRLLSKLIKGYQQGISPLMPARCRYYPTCSQYGLQALAWHGSLKGGWLLAKRVCSCHPLGGHGIDFVPLPLYRFKFEYVDFKNIDRKLVYKDKFDYISQLNFWLKSA